MRALWKRYQEWRFERLVRRYVYASVDRMLQRVAEHLRRKLTDDEETEFCNRYARWMVSGGAPRCVELIDNAERAISRFIQDSI